MSPKLRDIDLSPRHPDHRVHEHGKPAHRDCPPGCEPLDHHLCPGKPGWEPEPVTYRATCRTPGCRNDGRTYVVDTLTNADGIARVLCAGCSEWVEDLT